MEKTRIEAFLKNNKMLLGKEFELTDRKSGESNHNFIIKSRGEKYVLRVSKNVSRRSRLQEEAKALEFLEENGVKEIPEKEWFGETEIGAVLIETYVGKEDLEKGDFTEEELRKSAKLLAEIHLTSIKKYNNFFNTEKEDKASLREIY
ncbi:MAG: hypothetical protein BRC26_00360, partial [Nanohaloarchaea archaeon QH_8_44_6]